MQIPSRSFCLKAVLFDFDGTLTAPGSIDFQAIRDAIECPRDNPILEFIDTLADEDLKQQAQAILEQQEIQAAEASMPKTGAEAAVCFLRSRHIPIGILTRNSRRAVLRALQNFETVSASDFDLILTREDTIKDKPHPDGVLKAAGHFNVEAGELAMVGDFVFDILAGRRAGALTVFLTNHEDRVPDRPASDFTIDSLAELNTIVRLGMPLPAGKLPNDLLELFIRDFKLDDP